MIKQKQYISTLEAAKKLELSVGTIQRMVDSGLLFAWKTPGGHRKISTDSIQVYLQTMQKRDP